MTPNSPRILTLEPLTEVASLADQVATTTVQDEQILSAVWSVGLNEYGNTEVDYLWAIGDM